ncbi:hypothetical protein LZ198_25805 [Myxococcus sp. K15C18031901]|uniref:hypothetical protein n=1 Tax=Myxococcus dinghuensis TaxID=2906761 RepID=UPI0020A744F9|nr:hypothetical protein [Myxococcus dinghuensis]MCP3102290.1 hypothetical protein [Myxococcus dinghuensis]
MVQRWWRLAVWCVLVGGLLHGGPAAAQAVGTTGAPKAPPAFQVVARKPPPASGEGRFSAKVKQGGADPSGYEVRLDGRTFFLPGLSALIHDPGRNRLITYGQSLDSHVGGASFEYRAYSAEGQPLVSTGQLAQFPHVASVEPDGAFILAGQAAEATPTRWFVATYDRDAKLKWRSPLPEPMAPSEIARSPDGDAVGILLTSVGRRSSFRLLVYDGAGNLVYSRPRSSHQALAFTRNRNLILCGTQDWEVLDTRRGLKPVASGRLAGLRLDSPAIRVHPTRDVFILTSMLDQTVVLQAFRGSDGALVAESRLPSPKPLYFDTDRLRVAEDGTLQLKLGDDLLTLKLPAE